MFTLTFVTLITLTMIITHFTGNTFIDALHIIIRGQQS